MSKDDICKWMHMAWNVNEDNLKRKFEYHEGDYLPYERFAKLVAEHEREACALICEEVANKHARVHYPDLESVADECSGKIRARDKE